MKKSFLVLALLLFGFAEDVAAQEWVQTNGPGGNGIKVIAFNKQKHMFVLSDALLRSTDNGASWKRIGPQLPHSTITYVAIAPNEDIYINIGYDFPEISEIWKSTDNGETWGKQTSSKLTNQLAISSDGTVYSVGLSLDQPQIGYVLISTDEGKTWDSSFVGQGDIGDIAIDMHGNVFLSEGINTIRSTDQGASWSIIINGLQGHSFQSFSSAPNGDDYLLTTGYSSLFFTSTDGGRTWTRVLNLPNSGYTFCSVNNQGRILLTGGSSIAYYSDDNSKTWKKFGLIYLHPDEFVGYSLIAAPNAGFYAGSTLGNVINASIPDTLTSPWKSISTPISIVPALFSDNDGNLIATSKYNPSGLPYNTFSRSSNEGFSWDMVLGDQANPLMLQPFCYAATADGIITGTSLGIYKSTNSGVNWQLLIKGPIYDYSAVMVDYKGYYYASSQSIGVFRSTDNGATWDQLNKGLRDQRIYSLAVNSKNEIFAGTRGGIYKTMDQGLNWQITGEDSTVNSIIIDKKDNIFAGGNTDIVRSKDDGNSWQRITLGLSLNLNSTTFPFTHALTITNSGAIFAGTDSGIFKLDTGATAWLPYSKGLTTKKILCLSTSLNGRLFAGSEGSGVFKSSQTFNIPANFSAWIFANDLDFGTVNVGDTVCKDITISNFGSVPLILSKKFIVLDPVPFSADPKSILPITLMPNDSVSLTICFHPPQPANYTSEIDWTNDIDTSVVNYMKPKSFVQGIAIQKSSVQTSPTPEIKFSFHPNPTSGNSVTIDFSEALSRVVAISVYDVLGREVYRNTIAQGLKEFDLPIRDLSEGIYYARMELNGKTVTEQFVKVK